MTNKGRIQVIGALKQYLLLLLLLAVATSAFASVIDGTLNRGYSSVNTNTRYLGILIPIAPQHYGAILQKFKILKVIKIHSFVFEEGTIYKVPVVLAVQPLGGNLMRALLAQTMADNFDIKAFIYPGTSGAHISFPEMHIGDVVINTKSVNFGDFYMNPDGKMVADEYDGVSSLGKYLNQYINPTLEKYAACAASRVAAITQLPAWINNQHREMRVHIFYYGIQGSAPMWVTNKPFMRKTDHIFHEMDEDGGWYAGLVARMDNIPFIEISTITDSPFEFAGRGLPLQDGHRRSGQQVVQNISDMVALKLIKEYGISILHGEYPYPKKNPFPALYYRTPLNPRKLLESCNK